MATLTAATLSSWHLPTMMKWILDGGRSVSELGLHQLGGRGTKTTLESSRAVPRRFCLEQG